LSIITKNFLTFPLSLRLQKLF